MTKEEIIEALKSGPKRIYSGYPKDIYFEMQNEGLIIMTTVPIDSQETAIEVKLAPIEIK